MTDATLTFAVGDDDTAAALGSGSLPVARYAAPAGVVRGGDLRGHRDGAGRGRDLGRHPGRGWSTPAASRVGVRLDVSATSVDRDSRLHRFSVVAREADGGRVVANGEVTRVVVQAERFLGRL